MISGLHQVLSTMLKMVDNLTTAYVIKLRYLVYKVNNTLLKGHSIMKYVSDERSLKTVKENCLIDADHVTWKRMRIGDNSKGIAFVRRTVSKTP